MGLTVYAENMGFFHKGSGGKGIAPGDVCMTPPPPPAGPIPVPYVNIAQASDLTKGSKTVKIDGEPTALEDVSEISTSTGNEPGSQPPKGVVTATNKGKASFTMWSFTVKVEGKGVCRHGDPMFQNTSCTPPNCLDAAAAVRFRNSLPAKLKAKCSTDYDSSTSYTPTTDKQKAKVQKRACWECSRDLANLKRRKPPPKGAIRRLQAKTKRQREGTELPIIADHQPTQKVAWYMGGCNMDLADFKAAMRKLYVKPHCNSHSPGQPGRQSNFNNQEVWDFMKARGI
ncbi:DUF4150 domain-containing protein [Tabrizicola sp.]|uniref:DUF4150 domain-containing protein n=1 Tax=Tabrizicola sp. TaxID=2005166 RepID=UPI0025F2E349|nr:DUF4150 domain-containing protein [Tabrizicola sp.]